MITRRTRRMASVAAIVAGTLVLGACGSSSGGSGSPGKVASQSAAASGPVTIKYLHRLPDGEGMTKVADIVKSGTRSILTSRLKPRNSRARPMSSCPSWRLT